jgi:hypothetical protein
MGDNAAIASSTNWYGIALRALAAKSGSIIGTGLRRNFGMNAEIIQSGCFAGYCGNMQKQCNSALQLNGKS